MKKKTAFPVGWCFLLLLTLALSFGCAPKNRGLSDATADGGRDGFASDEMRKYRDSQVDKRVRDYLAAEDSDPRGQDVLIQTAKTALGTPYVRGGTSTDGFDCSGFVQWTFNQVGVKLPRTAREQARVGRAIRKMDDMEVGDIVAFHHPKRGYHTGIYVGEGKFIHSPRKRTSVRINALSDPYFSKTFLGARRIGVSSPDDIAAAEKMLAEYREQESRRAATKVQVAKRGKGKVSTVAARDGKRKTVTKTETRAQTSKPGKPGKVDKGGKASETKTQDKKTVKKDSKDSPKRQVTAAPASTAQKTVAARPPGKDSKKTSASTKVSKSRPAAQQASKTASKNTAYKGSVARSAPDKKDSTSKNKGS